MKLSKTAKRMIIVINVSSLVFITIGAIYYRSLSVLPFAIGVVLGMGLNMLKIVMLERSIDKALTRDNKNAGNLIQLQFILRFIITGAVLVVAAITPYVSLWGAAAGIFTLQIAVMSTNFFPNPDES